jgi:hypothetical protein
MLASLESIPFCSTTRRAESKVGGRYWCIKANFRKSRTRR